MTAVTEYLSELGGRLRAARDQAGLSLMQVEAESGGRWKAARVGSYERGERRIDPEKLIELAGFYKTPAALLLTGEPDTDEDVIAAAVAKAIAADRARSCALICGGAS
jgi:transcriptional regulator with XRE-family HTH domain